MNIGDVIEFIQNNISSVITWVQNIAKIGVLIIGLLAYEWYRNNKNIKEENRFNENESDYDSNVIVGTIIKVDIIKEKYPRECLMTVETSDGKYIKTKIVVPIRPLKGRKTYDLLYGRS